MSAEKSPSEAADVEEPLLSVQRSIAHGRTKRPFIAVATVLASALGAIALAEGLLRIVDKEPLIYITPTGELSLARQFQLDSEMGFSPILGTEFFNEYGTRPNAYQLEKRAGTRRLLFIGDSVTQRGRIVEALRAAYGDTDYEYWNAGVGSFDIMQIVAFYQLVNARLDPDHVILSFHNNDLEITPITLITPEGRTTYSPARALRGRNPWLMERVRLYRLWIQCVCKLSGDRNAIVRDTKQSLRELARFLADRNIRFTVLLLPIFQPFAQWSQAERQKRSEAIAMLDEIGIRYFDLLPPLRAALRSGIDCQETLGDTWHPSDAVSRVFADYLKDKGLLDVSEHR